MRLSKQHKVYGAVLGLALAALVADRCVFSSAPAAAATESYAVTNHAVPAAVAEKASAAAKALSPATRAPEAPDDRRAISARLDELARSATLQVGESRDAFAAPVAWVGMPAGDDRTGERARKFVAEHRLTAVMDGNGRNAVAVVDGKPVRKGQTLDGFTLVQLSGHDGKAVFGMGGGSAAPVELRLSKTAGPAAATAAVAQAN